MTPPQSRCGAAARHEDDADRGEHLVIDVMCVGDPPLGPAPSPGPPASATGGAAARDPPAGLTTRHLRFGWRGVV